MEPYTTLFGRIIRLAQLPRHVLVLIGQILEARHAKATTPDIFATAARALVRDAYPADRHYHRAMRGLIGEVFRDCYYRLHLAQLDQEQSQQVLEQLRFNPMRLLYDSYLDNEQTQKDFAIRADVATGALSRTFKLLLYAKSKGAGEISTSRLARCFQKLGITPVILRG